MVLLLTKAQRKPFKAATVGALSMSLMGAPFAVPASFAVEPPAPQQITAAQAQQVQGIPGQYQIRHSKNGKIFIAGSNRDMSTSTIARLDEKTLQIEAIATLPITRAGTGYNAGYKNLGAFGIDVDDENGTIWVTNTRDNAVSVYDQNNLNLLWTNYGAQEGDENWIEHPREVKVDAASGKAFVTGRYFVSAIDLKTHKVEKIKVGGDEEGKRYISMNTTIHDGKLYVPERTTGKIYVIDTSTFKVLQEIQTHADVEGVDVLPSDIAIDVSEQEIYVSAQGSYDRQTGESKGNSGVTVYDLKTGEYKKSIPFGKQALALVNDEDRDLVYVTDFATGKVGVIDGRADRLIGEAQSASKGANDITLGADGEVYIANKDGFAPDTTIPFGMDYAQGTLTSKEETADSITKMKVTPENVTAENPGVEIKQITPQQETFAGYPVPLTGGDNRTLTNVSYNDIAGNLFENDIIKLGEKSITTGYPDGGFHPLESIERGAMAAYLYRLAGSPEFEAPAESPFSDVPTTHPFYKEIAWLKATGITTGWEDGTFRPEESINREAMAAFFYRAAGSPEVQQEATFTDVSGNPFAKEISWFQFSKLSTGWPDSTFRPHDSVKRDAMAAYVMRYMGNFDSVKVSVPAPAK
ncbi:S-layer homology domain-containing protein [Rothia dentocariosa]|uniref:S-layer homology domain-containing protein n=1 Tax=Rothia dentocariosa TaxID=2047 RepID=UPI00195A784F|nr:S-layer homology domain-containing protein [Rothia dentocariosa]VTY12028.1 Cellulosome-anchoring protein [Rothia dentocariosa]